MSASRNSQRGFHVIEIIIIIVVLALIGLIIWRVISGNNPAPSTASVSPAGSDSLVKWTWNGNAWSADNTAPACPDPLTFSTPPTDLSQATSVLYPGQQRGGNYKSHGGLRLDNSPSGAVTVQAIMDGYVTSGARYIEQGEVQYMFTIINSCGIAYRYDHLATLAPVFAALADSLPPAKENDSRTTNFDNNPVKVKAGDPVATAVGFKKTHNYSFDLGVYDYRKRNVAANNASYVNQHQNEISQAAYALCWISMFSPADTTLLQSLPAADPIAGKDSDYCD